MSSSLDQLIVISDIKKYVLVDDQTAWSDSVDYELFSNFKTRKTSPDLWVKTNFLDIYFNIKVNWGAPNPGFFEDIFPALMKTLTANRELFIFVEDESEDLSTVKKGASFFFSQPLGCLNENEKFLAAKLDQKNISWFRDTFFGDFLILMSGCISEKNGLDFQYFISKTYTNFGLDSLKEILDKVFLVFKVSPDGNGMFIASNFIDSEELRNLLMKDSEFLRELKKIYEVWGRSDISPSTGPRPEGTR